MLRLYGEEVTTISKLVKQFNLKQGNLKEQAILQQLVYARWAWKELFRRSIWDVKNVVIELDCDNKFRLPEDCERLINISVIDRWRKLQPLTCDPGLSTVEINCCKPKCSCNTCHGENTLCAAVDAISYITEPVVIHGVTYNKEIWTRYDNAAVQQETKTPTFDTASNSVVYVDNIETVCNVEVTDKGCIKPTTENMELLQGYFGVSAFPQANSRIAYSWYSTNHDLIPQPYNHYGYWNVNAADKNIIHIFRQDNGLHQHKEAHGIEKVIISYQTNGEDPTAEIVIPDYAAFAVEAGILWQQKWYNPRAGSGDKQYAKEEWRAAKQLVNKHLNPIRMEDIAKLQTQLRRW